VKIIHAIWLIGQTPDQLPQKSLPAENRQAGPALLVG